MTAPQSLEIYKGHQSHDIETDFRDLCMNFALIKMFAEFDCG